MNSRERVLAALRHEEADRVPIDVGGFRSTGIHAGVCWRLRRMLGLEPRRVRLYDVMQQLGDVDADLRARLHGDVVQIHRLCPVGAFSIARWKEMNLPDGTPALVPEGYNPQPAPDGGWLLDSPDGTRFYAPSEANYFEATTYPLSDSATERDVDALPWSDVSDADVAFVAAQAEAARADGRYAALFGFRANFLEAGNALFGFQNFMFQVAANPSLVAYLFDRLADHYIRQFQRYLPAIEGRVDVVAVGDDLGQQHGPILSPAMYRTLIKPYQARAYGYIRERSGAYLFLHSCGSIAALIPDLIEVGVQILNPVQTSARDMDPAVLKKQFGKDIVFWGGGCDSQHILPHGKPEDVRRDVRRRVEIFKPGGGFVFASIHNILADVPPENVAAMFDEAASAGVY
ncbi:MAG: methyltransferase [Candidatus Sumerlaeia bacterium]|nr:methyltransferase [Candidatus Sumerlaeia bacterium]